VTSKALLVVYILNIIEQGASRQMHNEFNEERDFESIMWLVALAIEVILFLFIVVKIFSI